MVFSLGGDRGNTEETRMLWKLAGMGFQFGTEIIAGVLLGWVVDRAFGTAPWGVVIGSIAGILVAMTDFIRKAYRINRDMDRADARSKRAKPHAAAPIRDNHDRGFTEANSSEPEELTHEQWKALRDREFESNASDDER